MMLPTYFPSRSIKLEFRDWFITEAKKDRSGNYQIVNLPSGKLFQKEPDLFGTQDELINQLGSADEQGLCISGFRRHGKVVNAFAQSSEENMAQTIMFAALTANRQFTTVFGYFPVLVSVLKNAPGIVAQNGEDLFHVSLGIAAMGLPEMKMLVNSDSAKYISKIWRDKARIAATLDSLHRQKNYVGMLDFLTGLKVGLGHVKAAFAIQLIYGVLACLDVHNIRVYAKLGQLGGMASNDIDRINKAMKLSKRTGSQDYYSAVQTIMDRFGLESQHFWDIWNDYVVRTPDSVGQYANVGPALNPFNRTYQNILQIMQRGGKWKGTPILVGTPSGMGGSQAHLAATTRGQEDFTQGLAKKGAEEPEDWRGAVNKFAHQKHPAFQLAKLISTPEGIETLRALGQRMASGIGAGPVQQSLFDEPEASS